eukprot:5387374-Pyramimonas_sp.AAC.1
MSTDGSVPLGDNHLNIPKRAKTPLSGPKRHEPTRLLRLDGHESCQNAVPGTSTPRINVTVAS